jgi:hypothetical protein
VTGSTPTSRSAISRAALRNVSPGAATSTSRVMIAPILMPTSSGGGLGGGSRHPGRDPGGSGRRVW